LIDRSRVGPWGATLLAALAATAVVCLVGAGPAAAAKQTCPDTFHVLHDDHIGKLQLKAGYYTITLRDGKVLTCGKASSLFTKFLEDFDGNLPGRWHLFPARRQQFRRDGTDIGFGVKRGDRSGHGGGHHPAGQGNRCPGTFHVEHNDHIGKLKLPAGDYRITRLTKNKPTCAKAATLFARFLQRPDGNLPDHWRLSAENGTFTRRHTNDGFRVKPA
jgi:hypothetical protein